MARNALPTIAASISNHRHKSSQHTIQRPTDNNQTAPCPDCGNQYELFSQGSRGVNKRPHRQCLNCYRAKRDKNKQIQKPKTRNMPKNNEVGGVFAQVTSISTNTNCTAGVKLQSSTIKPTHHVFSKGQWKRARFLNHPEVNLSISASKDDYSACCTNNHPSNGRLRCTIMPVVAERILCCRFFQETPYSCKYGPCCC